MFISDPFTIIFLNIIIIISFIPIFFLYKFKLIFINSNETVKDKVLILFQILNTNQQDNKLLIFLHPEFHH